MTATPIANIILGEFDIDWVALDFFGTSVLAAAEVWAAATVTPVPVLDGVS